jgi:hypothetical protein
MGDTSQPYLPGFIEMVGLVIETNAIDNTYRHGYMGWFIVETIL